MSPGDQSAAVQAEVRDAFASRRALRITGTDSKRFYGRDTRGAELALAGHRGIVAYEPAELVVTARAGTPLDELEAALAEQGQFLVFEPPRFPAGPARRPGGTLGGALAAGLAGPRRAYAGAPRDFVLGTRILTGRGDDLRFGGQVMKNVAGYDVTRLMAGAMGTLGVLLEVSLKVLPRPRAEATAVRSARAPEALEAMTTWAQSPLPISGTFHDGERLYVRVSGSEAAVEAALRTLGGERMDGGELWSGVRDQRVPFFEGEEPLWRLALPDGTPPLDLPGRWALGWGGTERWLRSCASASAVRTAAAERGGHATLFRGGERSGAVFQPLSAALEAVHRRLKDAFDPARILNPGRLYPEL